MPRNSPQLKETEKGKIFAYKLQEKSINFMARELSRPRTVVRNYLEDPESYGARKRLGRPPKITNATWRRLFREASKGQLNSRDQ